MLGFFQRIYSSPKTALFYGALAIVLMAGVFVRTYHFADWLHFETDQVDDYLAVSPAIESGMSELPIVGPKAAGTDLRLGPAFYFLEFVSASVFGNTPAGHAGATLFFAILSLPLFFLTSRLFFGKTLSLFLTGIFAASPFLVLYSRFSWNPNVLPFFMLLIIFTLIKSVSEVRTKRQIAWFSSFAVALGISMQLHMSAFVTLPALVGSFLLWRRPRIARHAWILASLLFLVTFSPTLLYEIRSGGQTFHAFIDKADAKSENDRSSIQARLVQNIRYHAGEYLLILTGYDTVNGGGRPSGSSFGIACGSCAKEAPYRTIAYAFFTLSILLLISYILKETEKRKKDFLVLALLWLTFSFLFFLAIMLSGKYLYPRFFLLVGPLPIFFFGFILHAIDPHKNIVRFYITLTLTAFIVFIDMKTLLEVFEQSDRALSDTHAIIDTEDIFPTTGRITLDQQRRIVDFITRRAHETGVPVYLKSESEYEPSFWLMLRENNLEFHGSALSNSPLYEQGLYVFVFRSASPLTKDMRSYRSRFSIEEEVPFGSLTLQVLRPKPENIAASKQTSKEVYQPEKSALAIPRFGESR